MREQLVTFETAKLAKERGFETDCLCTYNEEGGLESAIDFTGNLYMTQEDIRNAWDNEYLCYLAPTQSLLQKWLRDEYKIHIIFLTSTRNKFHPQVCRLDGVGHCGGWHDEGDGQYNTYEQALEKGLQEALKLIN